MAMNSIALGGHRQGQETLLQQEEEENERHQVEAKRTGSHGICEMS